MTPETIADSLVNLPELELDEAIAKIESPANVLVILQQRASSAVASSPSVAVELSEIASRVSNYIGDNRAVAYAERTRSHALRKLGDHETALAAIDRAVEAATLAEDSELAATVQIPRCDSLGWLGRYQEAETSARQLITLLNDLSLNSAASRVLTNLAIVYTRLDRIDDAIKMYSEARTVLASLGDSLAVARIDFNLAQAEAELFRAEESLEHYRSCRIVFEQQSNAPLTAKVDHNTGHLMFLGGQYAAALAAEQNARDFFNANELPFDAASCELDIADVFRSLNLYQDALSSYAAAQEILEPRAAVLELGRIELGRAACLAALNHPNEAASAIDKAELHFSRSNNQSQLAGVHLLRAYWHRQDGNTTRAVESASIADRIYSRFGLRARAAEARFIQAESALSGATPSVRKMSSVLRTARELAIGWLECRAHQALGNYYLSMGKTNQGLAHLRKGVLALESARTLVPGEELHTAFISDKLAIYEDLIAALIEKGSSRSLDEALDYVEQSRSRLLYERVQTAISGTEATIEGRPSATVTRLAALRARLNRLYTEIHPDGTEGTSRLIGSEGEKAAALLAVENEYNSVLRSSEFNTKSKLKRATETLSSSELRCRLAPGETLIEYYTIRGTICAFVVTKGRRVRVFREMAFVSEITSCTRKLRFQLSRAGASKDFVDAHAHQFIDSVRKPLSSLYDLLIKPLLHAIPGKQLTIVPHGVLHGIPFHALFDGERYLIDRFEVAYSPSAAIQYCHRSVAEKHDSKSRNDLVMGVPTPSLSQIEVEVTALAATLPDATVYCGESATLEQFRKLSGNARMIHLATHGEFRPDNPLFSSLRFADGPLLARDLYSMRLDCDLVTLSACRTGEARVEAGDETFGLLRGFLAAGARSVAVSLWAAEDTPTATLMASFHRMMASGRSRSSSLRLAQLKVRQTWQHPYQWATFALYGER